MLCTISIKISCRVTTVLSKKEKELNNANPSQWQAIVLQIVFLKQTTLKSFQGYQWTENAQGNVARLAVKAAQSSTNAKGVKPD